MTSSANSPLEDLDGLRTHVFVPGLTQIIFAVLIRGSPVYDKNGKITTKSTSRAEKTYGSTKLQN